MIEMISVCRMQAKESSELTFAHNTSMRENDTIALDGYFLEASVEGICPKQGREGLAKLNITLVIISALITLGDQCHCHQICL
jgi:hypothetical protein